LASDLHILTLDVGTSSARTLLFDAQARHVGDIGIQIPYRIETTPDGGVEIDADHLADLAIQALDEAHREMEAAGKRAAAVAFCTFWHNVLGVGDDGRPVTPIIHLFDTRSTAAAKKLGERIDPRAQHTRTGCVLHPSYLPSKFLWLSEAKPEEFARARRWMSFGEYLFLKLFGEPIASSSMMSGTGLWNQNANDYDREMLAVLPVTRDQLASLDTLDRPSTELRDEFRSRWPAFAGIPWFPALGDGACNNIGSGCITPDLFSLMVGTSGAMRGVTEAEAIRIPEGLWCYRVDRKRYVLGGALSNGGEVFAWMKRTLALPPDDQIEAELAAIEPGSHGCTILPLFAGERSTKWRADARAAFWGMSLNTRPIDLLRAALESVSLRFRNINDLASDRLGTPSRVIASGGALLRSAAWTQMMADALGRPIVECLEPEATSRGAALLALERIGAIGRIRDLPPQLGRVVEPVEAHHAVYEDMLRKQRKLYSLLYEESPIA
jgi:gluconokinase